MASLDDKIEKQWDADLFGKDGLATLLGWLTYHTLRSKGSRAGFPDRVLVKDRIIYAELKREKRVSSPVGPEQVMWLDRLARAGGEVYLWRPSDLDEIGKVLGKPWTLGLPGELASGIHLRLRPASIWIPGYGRADGQ